MTHFEHQFEKFFGRLYETRVQISGLSTKIGIPGSNSRDIVSTSVGCAVILRVRSTGAIQWSST